MEEFVCKINDLLAQGELDNALQQMQNLLSIAVSELKNDAVILRGRLSKLKSDVRKGIINHSDETMEFSKISNGSLGLLDDIQCNATDFNGYLNDINESVTRVDKSAMPTLEESELRKSFYISETQKATILQRMANVKERNLSLRALWIDDNPPCVLSEQRLLNALNVQIDSAFSSENAALMIKNTPYDLIVSDLNRNGNVHEGYEFIKELVEQNIRIPTIFYITKFHEERGVPPYTFGITNRPTELLHLVMDIIERK